MTQIQTLDINLMKHCQPAYNIADRSFPQAWEGDGGTVY